MAKPTVDTIVRVWSANFIEVWTDDLILAAGAIEKLSGVVIVTPMPGCLLVKTDPRFDVEILATEIQELLKFNVPEEFQGIEFEVDSE